jgi:hypothetical protein
MAPAVEWLKTEDVFTLIMFLAWSCLSLTNAALKSGNFVSYFPTEAAMMAVLQFCPLQFAPDLMKTLQPTTAPTLDFFKSLPGYVGKVWAVYALVFEKPGHRPRVYIGSGTNFDLGVSYRFEHYDKRWSEGKYVCEMPAFVEKCFQDGWLLSHKGLIAWTPMPLASEKRTLRALFLVLETVFALIFWAMIARTKDYYMPTLSRWSRESFSYDGCCNHFSINEGLVANPEDHRTRDEINREEAERKRLKTIHDRATIAANTKKNIHKYLEEQRHRCDLCVMTFASNAKLQTHLRGGPHKDKAAGIFKKTKDWCEICKYAALSPRLLQIHLAGPRHAKKIRVLVKSGSPSD